MRFPRLIAGTILLGCLGPATAGAWEEEPPARQAPKIQQYVRIFVPADRDRVDQWPEQGVRYAPPIAEDEFQRRLEGLRAEEIPAAAVVGLVEAEYAARFEGLQLVDGKADLKLSRLRAGAVWVPLDGCGLAVGQANSTRPSPAVALVGQTAAGQAVAMVDAAAENLQFDWSLRGTPARESSVSFALRLPACPLNRVLLDLPPGLVPAVDAGKVVKLPSAPSESETRGASGPADAAASRGGSIMHRWQVDLGSRRELLLQIAPATVNTDRAVGLLCEQQSIYTLAPDGMTVNTQLRIDATHDPVDRLELAVDAGLTITGAWLGRTPDEEKLPWLSSPAKPRGANRLVLELPRLLDTADQVVRLQAVGSVKRGVSSRLPAMRPTGVRWLATRFELQVPQPLVVQRLSPQGCVQTGVSSLPPPQRGELLRFNCLEPTATLDLLIDYPTIRTEVAAGTQVIVSSDSMRAETVADFRADRGETFELDAVVPANWDVESVEVTTSRDPSAQPVSVLDDWFATAQAGRQQLNIKLSRSLAPGQPLRCRIKGKRLNKAGVKLGMHDFRFVRFPAANRSRYLMSIKTDGARQLQLEEDLGLQRLTPGELSEADAERLNASPGALLLVDDEDAAGAVFSLSGENPKFAAVIQVEANVSESSLSESYQILCTPESTAVSRVLIHVSQPRTEPLFWRLDAADDEPLPAWPLDKEERLYQGLGPGGQSWVVQLPQPQTKPFRLLGRRSTTWLPDMPVALAALPEATSQRATLTVRATGTAPLLIDNNRLRAIPLEDRPPARTTSTRAAYRYEPSRDALSAPEPAVTLSRAPPADAQPGAWVWNVQLTSHYGSQDPVRHLARFSLENATRSSLNVRMPADVVVRRVTVSGGGKTTSLPFENKQDLAVPLPAGVRFPRIDITFEKTARPLWFWGRAEAAFPQVDVPVLGRQWHVWLPPDWNEYGRDPRLSTAPGPRATLAQRLLGPLWRGDAEKAFNLFSPDDWSNLPRAGAEEPRVHDAAELVLAELGDVTRTPDILTGTATWNEVFTHYDSLARRERIPPPPLLVDEGSLDEGGILPTSRVMVPDRGASGERGSELLGRANLVLLVAPEAVLLTTGAALSRYRDQLEPTQFDAVWLLLPGPLRNLLSRSRHDGLPFSPLSAWVVRPASGFPPWPEPSAADTATQLNRGWSVRTLDVSSDSPSGLAVFRPAAVNALSWLVFFVVLVLAPALAGRSRRAWCLSAALAVGVAWLVPEPLCSVGSGLFLGVSAAAVARWAWGRRAAAVDRTDIKLNALASTVSAAGLGAVLLCVLAVPRIWGQEAATTAGAAAETTERVLHRVLVPVDQQGVPTGLVYLPQDFYDLLHRPDRPTATAIQPWWVKSAAYSATLDWQNSDQELGLIGLKASYQVEVLQPNVTLRLPLANTGQQVEAAGTGIVVDGQTVQPGWQPDGQSLLVPIGPPGEHRIEISYRGASGKAAGEAGFQLSIPAAVNARLELVVPTDAPPIEIPTAIGRVVDDRDKGRVTSDLGPATRLAVSWLPRPSLAAAATKADVEQLLWLDVRPGAVVLAAKLGIVAAERDLRRLRLITEPGLQLLSHEGPDVTVRVTRGTEGSQILDLVFAEAVSETARLQLNFLLTETKGIGQFRLPRISLVGPATLRRQLGITVDAGLVLQELQGETVQPLPAEDFAAAWGRLPRLPDRAYRLTDGGQTVWNLAVSAATPRTSVRQKTIITAGRDDADMAVTADLETTGGEVFGYTVRTSKAFQVNEVKVVCQGQPRRVGWVREAGKDEASIAIRFAVPVTGPQQLQLFGRLLPSPRPRQPAPDGSVAPAGPPLVTWVPIRIDGADNVRDEIRMTRRFGALVDNLTTSEGLKPVAGSAELDQARVQTIGSWEAENAAPTLSFAVQPNNPSTSATLVTRIERHAEAWRAVLDYQLNVLENPLVPAKGVVDQLQFDVPPQIAEPLTLDPPCAARIVDVPGANLRRLEVRPPQPIANVFRLRIVAPLESSPGEPMRVPEVRPVGIDAEELFVMVPTTLQQQEIEWDTQGLRPAVLPEGASQLEDPAKWAVYSVAGRSGQAVLKAGRRTAACPIVRLADTYVSCGADGSYFGLSRFFVDPEGHSECTLNVPDTCRLMQVSVNGVPGLLDASPGQNQWRLLLGPDQLPQQIDVVFTGRTSPQPAGTELVRLATPTFPELPVTQSLWSIYPRGMVGPAALPDGLDHVTELRQERDRLAVRSEILDLPANVLAENTPDDLAHWYRNWARQQAAAVRYGEYLQKRSGPPGAEQAPARERWDAQKEQWAARLGTAVVSQRAEEQADRVVRPDVLLVPLTPTPVAATHLIASDALATIQVSLPHLDRGNFPLRLVASLFALSAGLILWWYRKKAWFGDYLASCPPLIGVLAGLAWWLWLTPSLLGWVIVALSLAAGIRPLPFAGNGDKTKRVKVGNLPLGNTARRG